MVKVEGYSGLTKKQEDLLRLGYSFKSLAAVTLLTNANPVTFKARAAQKADGAVLASSSVKLTQDKIVFTPKRRTDGLAVYTLEYTVNPDVKAKAEAKITDTGATKTKNVTLSAEYKKEEVALKVAVVHPNPGVKLSGSWLLRGNHGVGVDGHFDLTSHRFFGYNLAAWYMSGKESVVFKHNGSNKAKYDWGEFVMSYFRDVSEKSRVCGVAKYNVAEKKTTIEFGGDYKVDDNVTVRGKVNNEGMLGLGLTKKLMSTVNLTLGAQIDTKKVKSASITDYKFGFKLDFNSVFQ